MVYAGQNFQFFDALLIPEKGITSEKAKHYLHDELSSTRVKETIKNPESTSVKLDEDAKPSVQPDNVYMGFASNINYVLLSG